MDDEVSILQGVSYALAQEGIDVFACPEVEAAWSLTSHYVFDALLSDLQVSKFGGLEGIRLIRHVRANFPKAVVVAMSGHFTDEARVVLKEIGCALLDKPFNKDELIALLRPLKKNLPSSPAEGQVKEVERLDDLLEKNLIYSVLQPIVDLRTGGPPFKIDGVESLARLPEGSAMGNPEILFEYASWKVKVFETDRACIRAALQEKRRLEKPPALFLNIHPRSLADPRFTPEISSLVKENGFENNQIIFELTEQQTILDPAAFAETLKGLRKMGFRVSLDDYGVGFSSLQLVQDLKPDFLKISGHFCRNVDKDRDKQAILKSTVELAKSLGISTVIESVETPQEYQTVKALGLTYGQGYFFAKPAPAKEIASSHRFCF